MKSPCNLYEEIVRRPVQRFFDRYLKCQSDMAPRLDFYSLPTNLQELNLIYAGANGVWNPVNL
jgi:hypothetical protein